jgi:hypothetical protein
METDSTVADLMGGIADYMDIDSDQPINSGKSFRNNVTDLIVIGRLILIYFVVSGSFVKSVVVGFVPFV